MSTSSSSSSTKQEESAASALSQLSNLTPQQKRALGQRLFNEWKAHETKARQPQVPEKSPEGLESKPLTCPYCRKLFWLNR